MRYRTEDISKNMTESITSYIGKLEKSIIKEQGTISPRESEVSWIKNQAVLKSFFEYVSVINDTIWKYKVTDIEPLQYTRYDKEQYYNWHIDEHSKPYANGLIRKLSFTIFLNEEYKGGEFQLTELDPRENRTYITIPKKKNSIVVFHSNDWHRVKPVTEGVRYSLVGWVLGPKWK